MQRVLEVELGVDLANSRLIRSEQSAISRMIRGCGLTYRLPS
ncbi:MAG TPA: hypothetical protein VGJ25_13115 [Gaiellaceae bacterium]